VELGNEKIAEENIDEVVSGLFQRTGFANKKDISLREFQQVLKDFGEELSYMSLDMKCQYINNVT